MSENQPLRSARTAYDAVIFDMDGVVTDTASVHARAWRSWEDRPGQPRNDAVLARAWKSLFDKVLPRLFTTAVQPFDGDTDYRRYVDGRPREDGIRTFLASRGIASSCPDGELRVAARHPTHPTTQPPTTQPLTRQPQPIQARAHEVLVAMARPWSQLVVPLSRIAALGCHL